MNFSIDKKYDNLISFREELNKLSSLKLRKARKKE